MPIRVIHAGAQLTQQQNLKLQALQLCGSAGPSGATGSGSLHQDGGVVYLGGTLARSCLVCDSHHSLMASELAE